MTQPNLALWAYSEQPQQAVYGSAKEEGAGHFLAQSQFQSRHGHCESKSDKHKRVVLLRKSYQKSLRRQNMPSSAMAKAAAISSGVMPDRKTSIRGHV